MTRRWGNGEGSKEVRKEEGDKFPDPICALGVLRGRRRHQQHHANAIIAIRELLCRASIEPNFDRSWKIAGRGREGIIANFNKNRL